MTLDALAFQRYILRVGLVLKPLVQLLAAILSGQWLGAGSGASSVCVSKLELAGAWERRGENYPAPSMARDFSVLKSDEVGEGFGIHCISNRREKSKGIATQ